jgi:hypothetical protein
VQVKPAPSATVEVSSHAVLPPIRVGQSYVPCNMWESAPGVVGTATTTKQKTKQKRREKKKINMRSSCSLTPSISFFPLLFFLFFCSSDAVRV